MQGLEDFARKIYSRAQKDFILTPYGYSVRLGDIASGGNATGNLSITANADFILTAVRYAGFASTADAGSTVSNIFVPSLSLLITDQGSNEQYTSSAVKLSNYGFNAQQLGTLPYPRYIAGRTALTLQVTNDDTGATAFGVEIYLEGVLARTLS